MIFKIKKGGENIAKKSTIRQNRYNKKTYKSYTLRLRIDNQKDLIEKIEKQESKNDYLVNLIKKDMQQ